MGMFTGYYESGTKNALECARECLHTRSLKTSPVTLFGVKNCDPLRYKNCTFQKLENVLYRITMFTHEANQYIYIVPDYCLYHLLRACLTSAFNSFLKHQTGL